MRLNGLVPTVGIGQGAVEACVRTRRQTIANACYFNEIPVTPPTIGLGGDARPGAAKSRRRCDVFV